jgi:hypothetical protein
MKLFRIFPDRCRQFETVATCFEMAYRGACCFYNADTKIAVMDTETGDVKVYSRVLDKKGNLLRIVEHDKVW